MRAIAGIGLSMPIVMGIVVVAAGPALAPTATFAGDGSNGSGGSIGIGSGVDPAGHGENGGDGAEGVRDEDDRIVGLGGAGGAGGAGIAIGSGDAEASGGYGGGGGERLGAGGAGGDATAVSMGSASASAVAAGGKGGNAAGQAYPSYIGTGAGGAGGSATAAARGVATSSGGASATADAEGGDGGVGAAGIGGQASASAIASSNYGGPVTASATQKVGNGGKTIADGAAAFGFDSTMANHVVAWSVGGDVSISQSSTAGDGGEGGDTPIPDPATFGNPGYGGFANSTLGLFATHDELSMTASSVAAAGAGGKGWGPLTGMSGGTAHAGVTLIALGGTDASGSAAATGGDGGNNGSPILMDVLLRGDGGSAGDAHALSQVQSLFGDASASATAAGGDAGGGSSGVYGLGGSAVATAVAIADHGNATAHAYATGGSSGSINGSASASATASAWGITVQSIVNSPTGGAASADAWVTNNLGFGGSISASTINFTNGSIFTMGAGSSLSMSGAMTGDAGGSLHMTGGTASADSVSNAGSVTLSGGTFSTTANYANSGSTTVSDGASLTIGGTFQNTGQLAIGSENPGSVSISSAYSQTAGYTGFRLLDTTGGSSYDKITFSGAVTLAGGGVVISTAPGGLTSGTPFDVMKGSSLSSVGLTVVDISSSDKTFTASVFGTDTLRLTVADAPNWSGATSSIWSNSSNWSTGTVPNATGAKAHLGPAASARTVTLTSGATVGVLNLDSTAGYTLSGSSTLTLNQSVAGAPVAINSVRGTNVVSVPLSLGKNLTATVDNTLTLSGNISGSGSLAKTGTGTLYLTGTNTYAGPTSVAAGTLKLSGGSAIPDASPVTVDATLDLNGSSETIGSLAGNSTASLVKLGTGTLTLGGNNATTSFAGAIQDSGSLVKAGTGTLTLSGTNTYTGGTSINAGAIAFASAAAIAGTGANVTIGASGTAAAAYAIDQTFVGRITTGSAGTAALAANSSNSLDLSSYSGLSLGAVGIAAYSGTLTPYSSTYKLGGGGTLYVNSDLTGSTYSTTITGPGTVALTGNNSYGKTTLNGGTLQISYDSNLGAVPSSATADSISVPSGKSATLELSPDASTLFDPNFVSDTSTAAASINPTPGQVSLSANRGLTVNGSLTIDTTDASKSLTIPAVIAGTGSLAKTGDGTLILSGTNTYTGQTQLLGGTLAVSSSSNFGNSSNTISFDGGSLRTTANMTISRTATLNAGGGALDTGSALTYSGIISGSGSLTKLGSDTLTLSGTNTYTGGTTISAGTLQVGNGGTTGTIAGSAVNNSTMTFNRSNTLTYAGVISGTGAVTKMGTGTLIFSGANTYTGTTTISAGTLQVGNGSTTGAIAGPVIDNAKLAFSRSNAFTYAGNISGSGSLTKLGTGTLTLSGTNTYTGGTTISAGTLLFNSSSSLPATGSGYISAGAVAAPNYAIDQTFVNRMSAEGSGGTVALTVDSSNNLSFVGVPDLSLGSIGNHTYSGVLTPDVITGSGYQFGGAPGTLTIPATSMTGAQTTVHAPGTLRITGSTSLGTVYLYPGTTFIADPGSAHGTSGQFSLVSDTDYATISVSSGTLLAGIDAGSSSIIKSGPGVLDIGTYVGGALEIANGTVTTGRTLLTGGTVGVGIGGSVYLAGDFSQDSSAQMLLHAASASSYDQLQFAGNAALDGTLNVDLLDSYDPALGDSLQIFQFSGSPYGTFTTLNLPVLGSNLFWDTSALYTDGLITVTDIMSRSAPESDPTSIAVPEPATLGLFMTGGLALAARQRRR